MINLTFSSLSFLFLILFTFITCQKDKVKIDKTKLINEKILELTENRTSCSDSEPSEIPCEPQHVEGCTTLVRSFYNLTGISGHTPCLVDITYKVQVCPSSVTIYDMQIEYDPSTCTTLLNGMATWFGYGGSQYDYFLNYAIQNAHYYARDYEKSLYNPS